MKISKVSPMVKAPSTSIEKKTAAPRKKLWETIGHIAVDSGLIWVSDPCQVFTGEPLARDWIDFLDKTGMLPRSVLISMAERFRAVEDAKPEDQPVPERTEPPTTPPEFGKLERLEDASPTMGIVVRTRHGDAYFPVEAKRDRDGMIAEIRIRF